VSKKVPKDHGRPLKVWVVTTWKKVKKETKRMDFGEEARQRNSGRVFGTVEAFTTTGGGTI